MLSRSFSIKGKGRHSIVGLLQTRLGFLGMLRLLMASYNVIYSSWRGDLDFNVLFNATRAMLLIMDLLMAASSTRGNYSIN